jgi:hypothetical protein
MPANGQKAAANQLNNIFGNGLNQRTAAAKASESTVRDATAATTATAKDTTGAAPATADAAPKGSTMYQYVGLCDALNSYEKNLVATKKAEIPNTYTIKFLPESIKSSQITKQGPTDNSLTPMVMNQTPQTTLNSDTNSVDTKSLTRQIRAGTPIVQVIEQLIRNSTFITDQQTSIRDKNGKIVPSSSNTGGNTNWFKINFQAIPKTPFDKIRNGYAFDFTYTITTYGINQVNSPYFANPKFRGIHKIYNYWFTGENTQVLSYEQEFNCQYIVQVSPDGPINAPPPGVSPADLPTNVPIARAAQSDQGGKNGTNDPAANLADFLYSPGDQTTIKLKIIGDPAWLQQGEVISANPNTMNFNGFNPDGTINFDSQQIILAVNFNKPADYNLQTGLMEINKINKQQQGSNPFVNSQSSVAYIATTVKSHFSKGRFEQDIEAQSSVGANGVGNLNPSVDPKSDAARPQTANVSDTRGSTSVSATGTTTTGPVVTNEPATAGAPSLQTANPAKPPADSSGPAGPQAPLPTGDTPAPPKVTPGIQDQLSFGPLARALNTPSQRTTAAQTQAPRDA